MLNQEGINSLTKLRHYCEKENFKGWDVSDSIASKFVTHTFLGKIPFFRFLMIQLTGHRIAVLDVRPFLFIPKYHNAKGIALFLNGYCNLYNLFNKGINIEMTGEECLGKINYLSELLISLKNQQGSGAGWGYPTAWQGRTSFYFPPNTPTVVATSFAVEALFHSYEITKNVKYKEVALSSANFVLSDLKRTKHKDGFIFSYSPIEGHDLVYNASLLGGKILTLCYKFSNNSKYLQIAKECIQTVVNCQHDDGSWYYGAGKYQTWIDNFHTGYNLEAIDIYQSISKDYSFQKNIEKGVSFFINNFFEKDYSPKYYHNKQYPIDIHCCGELFVVLNKLKIFEKNKELANGVLKWTIQNMQHPSKGYFYFQKRRLITNKTPLMRWSQAFMFNALTNYIKSIY